MKCSHEYHIVLRRYLSLIVVTYNFCPIQKSYEAYRSIVNKRPIWQPVTIRQLPRICFSKVYCFSFTHSKRSSYFSFINTQFNLIPGSGNLWRHIIRDHLWPQNIFRKKFSNKTYFFLSANNQRAKRWCAKYIDRSIFLSRRQQF